MQDNSSEAHGKLSALLEAYSAAPSGKAYLELAEAAKGLPRDCILSHLQKLFYETMHWRIAQHLALIYINELPPHCEQKDVVRAILFAHHAIKLSDGHPLARVVMARLAWIRRIPWAVMYECKEIENAGEDVLASLDDIQKRLLLGQACMFRGMALAYLNATDQAVSMLERAEEAGVLNLEAVLQLLFSARSNHGAGIWAASRLASFSEIPQRASVIALGYLRVGLVQQLKARVGSL